jgi:hypothetical protein
MSVSSRISRDAATAMVSVHVLSETTARPREQRGSGERADNFSISGLRESLQCLRAYEAEGPELQDVTRHDGVVRSLADSNKVELAQHHVKLLISPPKSASSFLAASSRCGESLAALMPASVRLNSAMYVVKVSSRGEWRPIDLDVRGPARNKKLPQERGERLCESFSALSRFSHFAAATVRRPKLLLTLRSSPHLQARQGRRLASRIRAHASASYSFPFRRDLQQRSKSTPTVV